MLQSGLCDYNDAYIVVKGSIKITGKSANTNDANKRADKRDEGVIFINFVPFRKCISKTNNAKVDNTKDLDGVMSMYNLIEDSDKYSKTLRSLQQYYGDEPNYESFKSKTKISGKTSADGNTKDVEIAISLKYLENFFQTLEMTLINCEGNLILTWSSTCVITNSTGTGTFKLTETKLYVLFVTLSTKDNLNLT